MSTKVVLLAASATAMLWACSPESSEPASSEPQTSTSIEAPTETASEPVANPSSTPVETASDAPAEEPVRSASAHVHGKVNLAIVVDGSTITIELESPMYNLVGFEHAPETDEQKAAIESAEYKLTDTAGLFLINSNAGCVPQPDTMDVKLGGDHSGEHDTHDAHEHEDHDHGDEHDHDETHEHGDNTEHDTLGNHEQDDNDGHDGHDHEHHGEHASTHRDAFITYTFECANPANLSSINIGLMEQFPNITEMDVVFLSGNTQDLYSLTPTSTEINLRP